MKRNENVKGRVLFIIMKEKSETIFLSLFFLGFFFNNSPDDV